MNYREAPQGDILDFSVESCQQNNDNFTSQFLSTPDLDSEDNSGVELLAEFNINNEIDGDIAKKRTYSESNSLNCVLPSVTDELDDGVIEVLKCYSNEYIMFKYIAY